MCSDQTSPPSLSGVKPAAGAARSGDASATSTSAWSGPPLPDGTLTFLFTDIEGSTRRWEMQPDAMRPALARHDALLSTVFEEHGGIVVRSRGEGDSLFVVYIRATDALAGALAAQRAVEAEAWGLNEPLRVRIGLHTGEADLRDGGYYGSAVNRCARIRSAGHGGQILLSDTTADLLRGSLPAGVYLRDLGRHRLKDLAQPEQIYQVEAPGLAASFPALHSLDSQAPRLPVTLSSFVDRDVERTEIARLLVNFRLVTLTGPGGTGKTRLAVQVAAAVADSFVDGVVFVDLSPLTAAGLLGETIAGALGVGQAKGRSLVEALQAYLREKRLLLLLDNFEQVVAGAATVSDLLTAAPGLTALVTSRVVLRLSGEREYPVAPLPVPDPARVLGVAAVSAAPAVELFVQRAQEATPAFTLTPDNAVAVASICARLDGLPLAIELAAARTRLLPPHAMVGRMDSRMRLLTGGGRDLPHRQHSLRDTIAWSYDLLSPHERLLFSRLSVFAGGCTLDAAEEVCSDREEEGEGRAAAGNTPRTTRDELGDPVQKSASASPLPSPRLPTAQVLDGLQTLIDSSLLRQAEQADGEARVQMLETIREFGLERLAESGEAEALRRRHAEFMLALVEQAGAGLRSAGGMTWAARVRAEQENVRAALAWAVEHGAATLGMRMVAALGYWYRRESRIEGMRWAQAVLGLPAAAAPTAERAAALYAIANIARVQSDRQTARHWARESVAIWREVGDQQGLAYALALQAAMDVGEPAVLPLLDESIAILRGLHDPWGLALALIYRWQVRRSVRAGGERADLEESIALYRVHGDAWLLAMGLLFQGRMLIGERHYAEAGGLFERCRTLCLETSDKFYYGLAVGELAILAREQGDIDRAMALSGEAIALQQREGWELGAANAIECLAGTLTRGGRPHAAARLYGAAQALLDATGLEQRYRIFQSTYQPLVDATRTLLGEEAFGAAWTEGAALRWEQAVSEALRLVAEWGTAAA